MVFKPTYNFQIENATTQTHGKYVQENVNIPSSRSDGSKTSTLPAENPEIETEFSIYTNTTLTFMEALVSCGQIDKQLATIRNKDEQEKVVALIKETGHTFPYVLEADFWISGLKTDETETFMWFNDNYYEFTGMNYTNWNHGQPQTYSKPGVIFFWQGCVYLAHDHEYSWQSSHCDDEVKYAVCEKPRV